MRRWSQFRRALTAIALTSLVLLILLHAAGAGRAATSVDDLTGSWQLFVDDFLVASKTNVVRTYHPFQKYAGNPVLVADKPWEGTIVYIYGTVLPNETRTGFRMWYHTLRANDTDDGSYQLYATSTDGINWTKPNLGLRSWLGSTANNMYFTRPTKTGITSVIQTPGDPDPAQLYKFMSKDNPGYWAAWSSNGVNITNAPANPVFTGGSDVGQFCWDPHTQRYLGYVKNPYIDGRGLQHRAVALTTTTNINYWPTESLILWPDAYDDRWAPAGTIQRTHFYGLSAFAYESMYIGFLWIFRATDVDGYYIGPVFAELVSSRDGVNWVREEGTRPPILPLGSSSAWDDGQLYTARAPVLDGNTLKLYYGACDQVHGTALKQTTCAIGLATLRKDGFASLDGTATAGTVVTKQLTGAGGALQVNFQAVGGSLKVEVLDPTGAVLPGYSQADCTLLTGDSTTQAVTWATHTLLPTGSPSMALRFILQNASLYSFMAGSSVEVVDAPVITQQPGNQLVAPGSTAFFTVFASASSPLSFQWQKNLINLSDGGHYSGCTTATLAITGAESADVAAYRCVITNVYGSVTSSPATLSVVSNLFGAVAFAAIPPLAGDTSNEGRAITPDGRYVVGLSGTINGFFYDSHSNTLVKPVSLDGVAPQIVTGVGYRTDANIVPPQTQIILSGLSANYPTEWMTPDGGATWDVKVRLPSSGLKKPFVPLANALAGTTGDAFYLTWTDEGTGAGDNWGLRVGQCTGPWPVTPTWAQKDVPKPDTCQMNSVSSNGRGVGWRRNGTTLAYANYIADWNGGVVLWNSSGLDGTTAGQAYSVSADGTIIFGISPLVAGGTTNYGYKALFDGTFPGPATLLSIHQLPSFTDSAGAANLAVPYGCSPDGKYAVGMCFRGVEKATLWDTSATNAPAWTVTDLTDLAVSTGSAGLFSRLARAYSVGTNEAGNLVITGVGYDKNNPVGARAFLMTVSPPKAVAVFRPTVSVSGSHPAGLTFAFQSVASSAIMYYLEYTTNLAPLSGWSTIAVTPGNGGTASLSDPSPPDQRRFYRIRVE